MTKYINGLEKNEKMNVLKHKMKLKNLLVIYKEVTPFSSENQQIILILNYRILPL